MIENIQEKRVAVQKQKKHVKMIWEFVPGVRC